MADANNNYSPLIQGDPEDEYLFDKPKNENDGETKVTIASGISIRQTLTSVRPKPPTSGPGETLSTSATSNSNHSSITTVTTGSLGFQLYAKSYTIEKEAEMQAIMLHIRTWYGIDKIDRPGCGKIVKGFIGPQKGNVENETTLSTSSSSSSSSSSSDGTAETLRRITIIFEGSPRLHISFRNNFDKYYTCFLDNVLGRGGNTGLDLSNNGQIAYGGLYRGEATDFSKPLPPLAIKRIDGRDILARRMEDRPAKHINNKLGINRLQEEINTWSSLHYPSPHPRVIRIFDAFLDQDKTPQQNDTYNVASIVMEAAPAGMITNPEITRQYLAFAFANGLPLPSPTIPRPLDLIDVLNQQSGGVVNIYCAVHIMSQLFLTLFHMHNRFPQIIHRDIKGDNIIIWDIIENTSLWIMNEDTNTEECVCTSTNLYVIKLADFGDARFIESVNGPFTTLGTPAYRAPEVGGENPQTPAVDVYMSGVTLYTLLVGNTPFGTAPTMDYALWTNKLKQGAHALPDSPLNELFRAVDPEGQSVVQRMMDPDPRKRITIPELFNHPLFSICRKIYYKVRNKRVPIVPDLGL